MFGAYGAPDGSMQPSGGFRPGYGHAPIAAKSRVTVLVLCILAGGFGVHRFYTGRIVTGLLQAFTLGGLGIWWAYDFVMILLGRYTDGQGQPLAK